MEPLPSLYSHLPWFEVFYKLLNTVGDLLAQDQVRPTSIPLTLQESGPQPSQPPALLRTLRPDLSHLLFSERPA